MSYTSVFAALIQAFNAVNATGNDYPVRYPNTRFDPPNNAPWLSVDVMPSRPDPVTMGIGGEDEHRGVLQVGLFFPLQEGPRKLIQTYDLFRTYFVAGASSSYGDVHVVIERCGLSSITKEDSWLTGNISVYYRSRITRQDPTVLGTMALIGGSILMLSEASSSFHDLVHTVLTTTLT